MDSWCNKYVGVSGLIGTEYAKRDTMATIILNLLAYPFLTLTSSPKGQFQKKPKSNGLGGLEICESLEGD